MWIGSINCNFVKFTDTSGTSEPISLQFGIWYYQFWSLVYSASGTFVFESCHGYPDSIELDSSWKAARAFSILAFISAIIVLIAACMSLCGSNPGKSYVWEAPVYAMTAFFQGLTLLLLNSNACNGNTMVQSLDPSLSNVTFPDTCSMDTGAKLSISATVFFFASSVASFLAHKAEKAVMEEEVQADLREPLAP